MKNKKILVYGFCEHDMQIISDILNINHIQPYVVIQKSMAKMKIRMILLFAKHNSVIDMSKNEEKIILFNDFTNGEINNLIDQIRAGLGSSPIMAVVTKTSSDWTFEKLLSNLIQERDWYKNNNQSK